MDGKVKLPGIGEVPKTYVIAGGALIAGIVGYAWWNRRNAAATPQWNVDSVGETGYVAPGANNSTYNAPAPGGITTNAAWANQALEWFQTNGYDSTTAALAIARYLAKKPLNTKEQDFMTVVTAQIGTPPTDGPWRIIPDPGPENPISTDGLLPNLARPGYEQMPNAPWRYTVALPGETWYALASRVYDWPKNGLPPDPQAIVRALRDINAENVRTPEPQAGNVVGYR